MPVLTRLLLTAALCLLPALALAGLDKPDAFGEVDTNKDGKISQEEFLANAKKNFQSADANKDGSLSPEEYTGSLKTKKDNKDKANVTRRLPMGW